MWAHFMLWEQFIGPSLKALRTLVIRCLQSYGNTASLSYPDTWARKPDCLHLPYSGKAQNPVSHITWYQNIHLWEKSTSCMARLIQSLSLMQHTEFLLVRKLTNILNVISFIKNVQLCGHDTLYRMETIQICEDL